MALPSKKPSQRLGVAGKPSSSGSNRQPVATAPAAGGKLRPSSRNLAVAKPSERNLKPAAPVDADKTPAVAAPPVRSAAPAAGPRPSARGIPTAAPAAPAARPSARGLTPAAPTPKPSSHALTAAPAPKPSARTAAAPAAPTVPKTPPPPAAAAPRTPAPAPKPSAVGLAPATPGSSKPSRIIRRDRPSEVALPKAQPAKPVASKAAPAPKESIEDQNEDLLDDPPETDSEAEVEDVGEAELKEPEEDEDKPSKSGGRPGSITQRAGRGKNDKTEKMLRPADRGRLSSRRVQTVSERMRRQKGGSDEAGDAESDKKALEGVADVVGKSSRRSVRASRRDAKPAEPFLTTKMKIMIGGGAILVLVAAIAWNPVRKKMLISSLEAGDASAAKELWAWQHAEAFEVFATHLKGAPANVRDASLAGITDAAKEGSKDAIKLAAELVKDGTEEEKVAGIKSLLPAAESFAESRGSKTGGEAAMKGMEDLVPVFIQAAKKDEPSEPVRLAAIQGLGKMPAPGGGCATLLKIIKEEKGPVREAALRGIETSAMPDAVGDLLRDMADPEDKQLAQVAKAGFIKVRDRAETKDLTPLLDNKSDEVRLEITKALAVRKGDALAAKGIAKAIGDSSATVRLEALKAVPMMGLAAEDLSKLETRITDSSEDVRIATAEAIASMHEETTWKILLQSFEKGLEGKTLQAFVKTLGTRGSERSRKTGRKDLAAIAIVIGSLDKNPGAASSVGEALALLTASSSAKVPAGREDQRRRWSPDQWKAWYANVKKRDEIENDAMTSLRNADKLKGNFDRYPEAQKLTESGLDKLDECMKLSETNDPEDVWIFENNIAAFQKNLYEFRKNQHLDMSHGN
ncbi:MAG: HEAT repeat domain-containing protein [Planctomycetes bacterium]|nr:HEAT repeat domain-containing protein [Planctomycetota bacterium]